MQGPMGNADATPQDMIKFGEGAGEVGMKVLRYAPDALMMLLPATGAVRVLRGLGQVRRGRAAWGASGRALTRGTQQKASALIQQEARRAGVPIPREQVRAMADSANRNFRVAKRLRTKGRSLQHQGRRQQKSGYRRMRPATAIDRGPEAQPLVDKEGRLIHAGYVPMRDLGKLRAQQRMAGRTRVMENGKLAKVGGRQMWRTPDGYIETERTMTVQREDGRWVNIPSFNPRTGIDYRSEAQALRGAKREGRGETSYRDARSAEIAAESKSRRLGEELRKRGY